MRWPCSVALVGSPTESCLLVSQTSWALPAMFYRLICQLSGALFVGGAVAKCWGGDVFCSPGPCCHTAARLSGRAGCPKPVFKVQPHGNGGSRVPLLLHPSTARKLLCFTCSPCAISAAPASLRCSGDGGSAGSRALFPGPSIVEWFVLEGTSKMLSFHPLARAGTLSSRAGALLLVHRSMGSLPGS